MLDVHCHLESQDYSKDRDEIIEKCKKELDAIITCCAHPEDFELTLHLVKKYKGFIFASVGIHPEFIKEISEKKKDEFLELIKENKKDFVAIGEAGLDFFEVKEIDWQKKQKELFIELINFAKDLKKPLIVHARKAYDDSLKILEQENAKQVLMHMFGAHHLLKRVIENNWMISMNAIVLKSKKHKKVIRDVPIEFLMLETDSPWLSPLQLTQGIKARNDPTSVKVIAEKIAEIKKISLEEIDRITSQNAIRFFDLKII